MLDRVSKSQCKWSESLVSLELADGLGKFQRPRLKVRTDAADTGCTVRNRAESEAAESDVTGIGRNVITQSRPCGDGGGGTVTQELVRCGQSSAGRLHSRLESRGFHVSCAALKLRQLDATRQSLLARSPDPRGPSAALPRARDGSWPLGQAGPSPHKRLRWSG